MFKKYFFSESVERREKKQQILHDVLVHLKHAGKFPTVEAFNVEHLNDVELIKELVKDELLDRREYFSLRLTLKGLLYIQHADSLALVKNINLLLKKMKELYVRNIANDNPIGAISNELNIISDDILTAMIFISDMGCNGGHLVDEISGKPKTLRATQEILKIETIEKFVAEHEEKKRRFKPKKSYVLTMESWLKERSTLVNLIFTLINIGTVIYNSFFRR